MKYAVTIERPSFATVVIEAEDELEAERIAEGKMYDVPVEEFHPHDNGEQSSLTAPLLSWRNEYSGGGLLPDTNRHHNCPRGEDAMQAAERHCMD